jgi:hypothetical protein
MRYKYLRNIDREKYQNRIYVSSEELAQKIQYARDLETYDVPGIYVYEFDNAVAISQDYQEEQYVLKG